MDVLGARLKKAVEEVGGLGYVIEKTNISKAQLSRYFKDTSIPSDRLIALADVTGVSVNWLLGEEAATKSRFESFVQNSSTLCTQLIQVLQRSNLSRALLPAEVGSVLELMLLSQGSSTIKGMTKAEPFSEAEIEYGLYYISGMLSGDALKTYLQGCHHILKNGPQSINEYWWQKWASIVQDSFRLLYSKDGPMKTNYYLRLNMPSFQPHMAHYKVMEMWSEMLIRNIRQPKIRLLDAGCGNGRHLVHLNRMGDRFILNGIDTASTALQICKEHVEAGRLPTDAVREGNFYELPYENGTFDAYMSITNFQFMPLIEDSIHVGVGKALNEAKRILRPGGYGMFLTRSDGEMEFFPYFNCSHSSSALETILNKTGLRKIKQLQVNLKQPDSPGAQYGRGVLKQDVWIFQKPM